LSYIKASMNLDITHMTALKIGLLLNDAMWKL